MMIFITLKDGKKLAYKEGITALEIAHDVSPKLARNALTSEMDGKAIDLSTKIFNDCKLNILTFDDNEGKKAYWHTTSHVLAQAVKRLYPNVKLAIGPAIENGFYYDFDIEKPFSLDQLSLIEEGMSSIIKENLLIQRFELSRNEAIRLMEERQEPYKVELIHNLHEDSVISFYQQGEFIDLCAGPHILNTAGIKMIKLMSIAGAYWRGNEKNRMLQRIYGISFTKKSELDAYLFRIEEAKKRDHRKLGKELDLFSIQDEGPGFPFFHPKGMMLRNELESFWRKEHAKRGYQEIMTPIMLNQDLWIRSGHWDHYKENMYFSKIDDQDFVIKPMNCPGSMILFKRKIYSYRDLPLRVGELGLVHRHELSGALHGLMRVRCFTQDDAHIFMKPDQVRSEIIGVINLTDYIYSIFGFKYHVELSTKPANSMGTDEDWEKATLALQDALEAKNITYKINEGDGAFYGPKIDFHLEDSIGRTWQCGTIQLDLQMPECFDLTYIDADGERHRPVMIHRTVFGSIERFIGILIEHFAGAFPLWLAPVQVKILSITDRAKDKVNEITNRLNECDLRVEIDVRNEKIGFKIRETQLEKIPYMIIIGDKEVEQNVLSIRSRKQSDMGSMQLEDFIVLLEKEIRMKQI